MAIGTPPFMLSNVSKRFHATQALDGVSLELHGGEIHSLVGENGAGKSTLIKVAGGVYAPDSGRIRVEGVDRSFHDPREAQSFGIIVIPQDLQLVPAATVAENVTMGDWPTRRVWGLFPVIDGSRMRERADAALRRLRFNRGLDERVRELSFAERQLVAVARAVCRSARVLILDEPTASLEHRESERLFQILADLKAEGVAILFVSHRLDEVMRISDCCTVLRDGRVVDVSRRGEIEKDRLVRLMAGRDLEELHRPHTARFRETLLERDDGEGRRVSLRRGEVVGLAGLLGAGTSTYLRELFGAENSAGALTVRGRCTRLRGPSDAIDAGIGLIPGERRHGLVMGFSVRDNIMLPHLDKFSRGWGLDTRAMDRLAEKLMETLDIRPRDPRRPVRELSGGNQQKVLFARWLVGKVDVLLLDEPSQGIDVGAKARVHRLMRQFAEEGGSILFASSEMEEVMSMSDSVLAMAKGKIIGRLSREGSQYNEGSLRAILGG